ncbi:MAG: competence/damage-inducible protein A [Desulfobacteraceae bacterium]|nr:competence/damage-inducible protein A [Desulfobacteraceae bacterium]
MEYRLLEKTELWISPVKLTEADLGACALAVARALGLNPDEIMVTDALEDRLTLDILVPTVRAEQIVARKERLLSELTTVHGVEITEQTEVHSEGILGLISLDEEMGRELLERSQALGTQIADRIRKRSMVFSTGKEVLKGQIRDTNTPFLLDSLSAVGFQAVKGPVLDDDAHLIARAFVRAMEGGFGLIVSTGGIGAEGKDQTLEALKQVDPQAKVPYILKFRQGQGRHKKDGIRIGVGHYGQTRIVCLPGPHDEVRLAWPVLREGVQANWDKQNLARQLANALRKKFLDISWDDQVRVRHETKEIEHDA